MKVALALAFSALALVAAGCGGDDGEVSSADEWADEFCTVVGDWETELERIGDELGDISSLTSESLQESGDEADAATDDMIESLRDLGAPDTESGDAIEQEVEEFSDTVDTEREDIRSAVDDIEGLTGVAEAVGEVGTSVAAMATALQQTLQAIADEDIGGEVRTALEESEACDAIGD